MNNKKTENLISDMLNSEKPDRNVLSSAKSIMAKNKPVQLRLKRQFYALSGCAAALIIVGVIFALLNQPYANSTESNSLQSIPANASRFDGFLITAVILISIGIALAITAIIIRVRSYVKTNKA